MTRPTDAMSLKAIRELKDLTAEEIHLLSQDPRKGVRDYAASLLRREKKRLEEEKRLLELKAMEMSFYEAGYQAIAGIDEVGRGPLAGPVVTCAVILPKDSMIAGINDSKKLSAKKREELTEKIKEEALAYSFGVMGPEHIDELNILNATKQAMAASVGRLAIRPDLLLIDAVELPVEIEVKSVIHGDSLCYSIGAASILAKTYRDAYMKKMAKKYPAYGFDRNMGYGTKEHIEAIARYGLTPIHRKSFCTHFVKP